jgi:hypothetical protein
MGGPSRAAIDISSGLANALGWTLSVLARWHQRLDEEAQIAAF